VRGKLPEGVDDALVSNLEAGTQSFDGHGLGGCREQLENP
jgi:hypothetical protein